MDDDQHKGEVHTDPPLILLVSEMARLIEQRSLPTDEEVTRIRDLRTKMLHEAALEGVENCR
jgi:hypothetical protein